MTYVEIARDRFDQCEAEASRLLTSLAAGDKLDLVNVTQGLRECLEYALCDLFEQRESTRGYWADGVIADRVEMASPRIIRVEGYAWCAKGSGDQWQTPAQAELHFSSEEPLRLEHLRIRVGDADFGALSDHRSWRRGRDPEHWLLDFRILRPPDLPKPDPIALIDQLQEWADANSTRPIVGPNWQPLTLEQAAEFIRIRATEGLGVTLEGTWLDGGVAIRLE